MRLGKPDEALERARRASAIDPEDAGVLYNVGCIYALAEKPDQAIDYLDQAIRNGFGQREWLEYDSSLDSLRDDPKFQALLRRL